MTHTFQIDSTSRIKRIGTQAKRFDSKFNTYVQSYVHAKRSRNKLTVSDLAYNEEVSLDGLPLAGDWKILSETNRELKCQKI